MSVYFSEKFKKIRKDKDLTQEQIAEIFHISPKCVSRWETGATYPDIELLPSIASYFEITVDELLGVDKIKDNERITGLDIEICNKWHNGYIGDALEIARNAVREFPQEYKLQLRLAMTLDMPFESDEEKKKDNLLESINILERILENSTDDEIRNSALYTLSRNYKKAGDKEKAVETAKKLSGAAGSSDVVLTQIYEGGELHEHLKKNIANYTHSLAWDINQLANSMYNSGSHERIELNNKAIGIIDLIYENGDYGFDNFYLSRYYFELAENYCGINDMDNALSCLEKAAQHAVDFDALKDFKQHTSLAVQGLGITGMLAKNIPTNQCYDLLHGHLPHVSFDLIKNDERYKAVISKLEKHAKSY